MAINFAILKFLKEEKSLISFTKISNVGHLQFKHKNKMEKKILSSIYLFSHF